MRCEIVVECADWNLERQLPKVHELPTPKELGHQFDEIATRLEHEEFVGIKRIKMVVRRNTRLGDEQSASPDKDLVTHAR